ncbi:MAG: hypothetical protein ACO2ON_03835 [Candidatus Nanopusillus sp.]
MNPIEIVEKAYKLIYLVEESNTTSEAIILILTDDWKKYMREIIYKIILAVHEYKIYETIRDVLTSDGIKLLYILDNEGFNEAEVLRRFIKLMHMYVSHSLRNKIDIITNKERWNEIYGALNEFNSLVKGWGIL